jgi:hypothetical protein
MDSNFWWGAFLDDKIWIDAIFFFVFGGINAISWWSLGAGKFPTDAQTRASAASSIGTTVGGGIAAVGILIPATLITAQIGHPTAATLSQIFFADVWFTLSLVFGLHIVFMIGVKAGSENVLNHRRLLGIPYGLQLLSLLVGVIRLLVGIAILFSKGT